jgi:hypothetical protein
VVDRQGNRPDSSSGGRDRTTGRQRPVWSSEPGSTSPNRRSNCRQLVGLSAA